MGEEGLKIDFVNFSTGKFNTDRLRQSRRPVSPLHRLPGILANHELCRTRICWVLLTFIT
jgi:hypothetical protein